MIDGCCAWRVPDFVDLAEWFLVRKGFRLLSQGRERRIGETIDTINDIKSWMNSSEDRISERKYSEPSLCLGHQMTSQSLIVASVKLPFVLKFSVWLFKAIISLPMVLHFFHKAASNSTCRNAIQPYHTCLLPNPTLGWSFIGTANDSGELLNLHVLAHNRSLSLILLVQWDLDDFAIDGPSTNISDKLIKGVTGNPHPWLKDVPIDFADWLRDCLCYTNSDEFFKSSDIGNEICVEVIAVQGSPESAVWCCGKKVVENIQLDDCFG